MSISVSPISLLLPKRLPALAFFGSVTLLAASGSYSALATTPLGVSELTRAALSHHPSLRVASALEDSAQRGIEAAKWQFWPTPSLGLERVQAGSDVGQQGDRTVALISLQQPLYTGGRLTSNLRRAESQALLTEAETQIARQALAGRVIQAWSEAVVAIRKLSAQTVSLQRHERLLAMVQRRLSEGASAQSDVALATSRIDVLKAEITLLIAQRDAALDKLRLLSGLALRPGDLVLSHEEAPISAHQLGALIDKASNVSPQLRKAQHSVAIANADLGVAKASLMPEVSLRYEHQQGNTLDPNTSHTNRLVISLNSALGAGLSSVSGVSSAMAQMMAAQEQVALQRQELIDQLQSDFSLSRAAKARLGGLRSASQASAEVLDSYERQFLAGRKQWLDLMNAAREQSQSESQLADALVALEFSSLRLVLLAGGTEALLDIRGRPSARLSAVGVKQQ